MALVHSQELKHNNQVLGKLHVVRREAESSTTLSIYIAPFVPSANDVHRALNHSIPHLVVSENVPELNEQPTQESPYIRVDVRILEAGGQAEATALVTKLTQLLQCRTSDETVRHMLQNINVSAAFHGFSTFSNPAAASALPHAASGETATMAMFPSAPSYQEHGWKAPASEAANQIIMDAEAGLANADDAQRPSLEAGIPKARRVLKLLESVAVQCDGLNTLGNYAHIMIKSGNILGSEADKALAGKVINAYLGAVALHLGQDNPLDQVQRG